MFVYKAEYFPFNAQQSIYDVTILEVEIVEIRITEVWISEFLLRLVSNLCR